MDPFSSLAASFLFVGFPSPPDPQFPLSPLSPPQVFPFPFLTSPFPSYNQTLASLLPGTGPCPPSDCCLQSSEVGKEQEVGWEWLCVVGLGRFSLG